MRSAVQTSVVLNRHVFVADGEPYVFNHLSGVELNHQYALGMLCSLGNSLVREWPQGDRADDAYFCSVFVGHFHCFLAYTCHSAECYNQIVAVLSVDGFVAFLVFLDFAVCALEAFVVHFHFFAVKFKRCNYVVFAVAFAGNSPRTLLFHFLVGAAWTLRWQHHFFHHLSHYAVGENYCRGAVFECQIPTERYEITHFLHRRWRQCDEVVVAVAAAFCGLEIVGL